MSSPEFNYNRSLKSKLSNIENIIFENREGLLGAMLYSFSSNIVRSFESSHFGEVLPEIIRGHTHDSISALALAYFTRYFSKRNVLLNASLGMSFASSAEFAQKYGLIEGTFDSKDLLAYGLGTVVYLGIEKTRKMRNKQMEVGQEYNLDLNDHKDF